MGVLAKDQVVVPWHLRNNLINFVIAADCFFVIVDYIQCVSKNRTATINMT